MHLPVDDHGRSNCAAPDPERDRPRRRVARHRGTIPVWSNTPLFVPSLFAPGSPPVPALSTSRTSSTTRPCQASPLSPPLTLAFPFHRPQSVLSHSQLFHGWYLTPYSTFSADTSDEWGLYNKALTAKALLEKGYALIAPAASSSNEDAWDTNCAPYADELSNWSQSDDYTLLNKVFDGIKVRRERERASARAREQCLAIQRPPPHHSTREYPYTPAIP